MSTPTLILLLANTGLSVLSASRNEVLHLADLDDGPQDRDTLREFLREWRNADFHLLADLAEEEFHYESVPHLARADRQALFQRKLDQAFRQMPYRRIAVQVPGKRGTQSKLMLSALTVREKIDGIVELLLDEKCAIAGIHSVPLASELLVRKLQLDLPHFLLVSATRPSSLRQSYFTPEGLRFSRLASHPTENDAASLATAAAEEVRRTRQYLTTSRLMNREDTLETLLLTDAASDPAIADYFAQQLQADQPQIRAGAETTIRLASRLGLPAQSTGWLTLLCIAIARGMIPDHYRPSPAGRYHWLRRMGQALHWSAAIIMLAGVTMTLQSIYEADRQQETIQQSERLLRQQSERKREFDGKLKALAASQPAIIKETNTLYSKYMSDWPDIEPTAQTVSRIFADFPLLALDRFSWRAHSEPAAPLSQEESFGAAPPQHTTLTPAAQTASAPAFDGRRWQIIDLTGHVTPFEENYRQALEQVHQLSGQLGKLPRATTTILKAPLDVTPQGQISQGENGPATKGGFLIRIVIAPAGGAQ